MIGYLLVGGLGLLSAPALALRLLGATGTYSPVFVRFVGGFMLAFALLVTQLVRHRVEVLYPTTLWLRVVLLGTIVGLYLDTRDPLFLVLGGIVGFGMALTGASLLKDRGSRA